MLINFSFYKKTYISPRLQRHLPGLIDFSKFFIINKTSLSRSSVTVSKHQAVEVERVINRSVSLYTLYKSDIILQYAALPLIAVSIGQ